MIGERFDIPLLVERHWKVMGDDKGAPGRATAIVGRIGRIPVRADGSENGTARVAGHFHIHITVTLFVHVKLHFRTLGRGQGGRTWERDKRKQRQKDTDCAKTETD